MSRGILYFISGSFKKNPEMSANSFCGTPEGAVMGEWYSDDHSMSAIEQLIEVGFVTEKVNNDFYKIRITKQKREDYFTSCWIKFKEAAGNLTLSDFSSKSMDWLTRLITDTWADAVYTEEARAYPFDEWLRCIEADKDYYAAVHTLIMH